MEEVRACGTFSDGGDRGGVGPYAVEPCVAAGPRGAIEQAVIALVLVVLVLVLLRLVGLL